MFGNLFANYKTLKMTKSIANTALSEIFVITFLLQNKERKVLCKMTNYVTYGRSDSFFIAADDDDLKNTIYAYYCNKGYPDDLQYIIDNAAHIIAADRSMDEHRIGDMLMTAAGAADIWAFWEGFRACVDIMTGNLFQRILMYQDDGEANNDNE